MPDHHVTRSSAPSSISPVLRAQDITKTVTDSSGALSILQGASLAVQPGETVALVGASGSGKSTLLSILAGLDVPSSGEVWLAGQPLFALGEDQRAAHRAAHIGFVFQNFQLIGHLTALENVMLPLELRGETRAHELATAMLRRVGLGERLGHRPTVMSGGEQQRVALARAFVVQPALLMADEPTGSLDHATGQAVIDLMFSLNADLGTALLLVTHDLQLARRCQRVLRVQQGRLTEEST
ncbi:ATP-binding cassette domain-containing protein [Aquabacterium lacunae]|uniref:ATP-binding cassette domain-containing protein n=1 Tax=Aquabacterium lacunae TaxID=2528630 RepID=A0A4Q9GY14_9BURK|nr:ATP-binding cassette domain-containing protein [Aquabacterium lacunae]TBO28779.1 ATP-binding cassette domain-containing protein [Aquabacterium lacunae]